MGKGKVDLVEHFENGDFEYVFCATYDFSPELLESYLLQNAHPFQDAEHVCVLADTRATASMLASGYSRGAKRANPGTLKGDVC